MELRPFEPDTDNAGVGSNKNFLEGTKYRCLFIFARIARIEAVAILYKCPADTFDSHIIRLHKKIAY